MEDTKKILNDALNNPKAVKQAAIEGAEDQNRQLTPNTTNTVGSVAKGMKIGEDKYTEHWSKDGSNYIEVPKWVLQQAKAEERERLRRLVCPCACDMFIDEDGYEEAHRGDMEALNQDTNQT